MLGTTELIIILVIMLLLFGVGKVSRLGGELGEAVSNFRSGLQSADVDKNKSIPEEDAAGI